MAATAATTTTITTAPLALAPDLDSGLASYCFLQH